MPDQKYCALLVAPDGDYVTDYYADTKEEVIEQLKDRGSRWFFYPFEFVITRSNRVVAAPPELSEFVRKSVNSVVKTFREAYTEACERMTRFDVDSYTILLKSKVRR